MATLSLDELNGGNSLGALVWQSGRIVRQWEVVISPANGEAYRRKTATGAGATDPSADLTNYRAASYERVTAISNKYSTGTASTPTSQIAIDGAPFDFSSFTSNAAERKLYFSLTGRGTLTFAALQIASTAAKTFRVEMICDGITIFDATFVQAASTFPYLLLLGSLSFQAAGSFQAVHDRLDFRSGVQIYLTSSVAITVSSTKAGFAYRSLEA